MKKTIYKPFSAFMLACVLLILQITPCFATSSEIVYFVAVKENLLPLSDETMPFWHNSYLYIASSTFTSIARKSLDISCAQIGDQGAAIYRGAKYLLFDADKAYALDTNNDTYAPGAIQRNGKLFIPASVVARYFDFQYSVTEVEHGYLVWLRPQDFQLKEKIFINAASFQLKNLYQEYLRELPQETEKPEGITELPETTPEQQESILEEEQTVPQQEMPSQEDILPSKPTEQTKSESQQSTRQTTQQQSTQQSTRQTTQQQSTQQSTRQTTQQQSTQQSTRQTTQQQSTQQSTRQTTQQQSTQQSTRQTTQQQSTQNQESTSYAKPAEQPEAEMSTAQSKQQVVQSYTEDTTTQEETNNHKHQNIYLCLYANNYTENLLDVLERHNVQAAFLCGQKFLEQERNLLRRITASGQSIVLLADRKEPQLEEKNRLLERATYCKTRLAMIQDGTQAEIQNAQDNGYCCLQSLAGDVVQTTEQVENLLLRASAMEETEIAVLLDASSSALETFLNAVQDRGDKILTITESHYF